MLSTPNSAVPNVSRETLKNHSSFGVYDANQVSPLSMPLFSRSLLTSGHSTLSTESTAYPDTPIVSRETFWSLLCIK